MDYNGNSESTYMIPKTIFIFLTLKTMMLTMATV